MAYHRKTCYSDYAQHATQGAPADTAVHLQKDKERPTVKTKEGIGSQTIVLGALVFAPLASAHDGGIEKGLGADAAGNGVLAANPELISHIRYQTCGC